MVRNGEECKNPQFSSVAATFETASTYVFAERLIRNAEVRGSTPLCSPFSSTIYGCRHWRPYFICGQFVDTFSGAQFDRFNGHAFCFFNRSHVTHRHPHLRVAQQLSNRERIGRSHCGFFPLHPIGSAHTVGLAKRQPTS